MRVAAGIAAVLLSAAGWAAPPAVSKVEPPDWWTGTRWNPVRLLIRGENLSGARVTAAPPLTAAGVRVNERGTYLFVDLRVPAGARPGRYPLTISTPQGSVQAPFELRAALPVQGRFQGIGPDDVLYLIMPDRFANGDLSNDDPLQARGLLDRSKSRFYHGGDLKGVTGKLDYLQRLGVTAVWLNPWYDNHNRLNERETYNGQAITDYHGYGAVDFYAVDEHLGSFDALIELVEQAHARGIKVIQDQVANHTGPYHPWTADSPTPAWYNGTVNRHLANTWQTWTLMDPHSPAAMRRATLDGWFINILPDLNQGEPETKVYLLQNSLWWVGRTGLDAIRQDTLPYVPRSYWSEWMRALKREFPRVNVIGEVFDGNPALVAFFQGGARRFDGIDSGVDSLFDFPVYFPLRRAFAEGQPIRQVAQALAHDHLYVNPALLVTFLGLHDVSRFMNERGATLAGLKLAFTFLLTARGVPLLYYGDEIGMPGGGDPDNRRDFPGGFPGDSRNAFLASDRTAPENEAFDHLRKLTALRRGIPALRRGPLIQLLVTDQQWVYARGDVIVAFNNGPQAATVEFPAPAAAYTDRLGPLGRVMPARGALRLELPPRTAAVLVPQE